MQSYPLSGTNKKQSAEVGNSEWDIEGGREVGLFRMSRNCHESSTHLHRMGTTCLVGCGLSGCFD